MYFPVTGSISCSDWNMMMAVMKMSNRAKESTANNNLLCFFITVTKISKGSK